MAIFNCYVSSPEGICCWFVHAPRKRTQRTQVVQNYLLGPIHWQIAVKRLSKLGLNLDHALPAGNAKRMLMVSYREKHILVV